MLPPDGSPYGGRPCFVGVLVALLALGLLALAGPVAADAAVNQPPALPHTIISFPERDFVSAAGFAASEGPVTVNVIRNGVTIATSDPVTPQDDPKTAGFDGLVEVNHPGGGCWVTTTPDILPGDIVRTTDANGVQDQTATANVTADRPTNPSTGTIVVHGTAQDALGNQLPLAQVEQRLVANKDLFDANGRRTLRAGGAGSDGTFAYDSPTSVNFTATYTSLDAADVTRAMGAESRALWLGANPGTGQELTIFENPGAPGPAAPCTAPLASNAVTSSDHTFNGQPTVNLANSATDLRLSGVAQADATSVSVLVTDGAGAKTTPVSVTLPGGTAGQTWSATIPATEVGALADGTLTASMTYSTALGGPLPGASMTLRKDTQAPAAPTATPPAGTYNTTKSVTLNDADAGAAIRYTTDGTAPDAGSTLFSAPIAVNATTTIRAIAIDTAGNPNAGGAASFVYTLVPTASLSPATIDFGSQGVNTTSTTVVVTMTNTGAADMTISTAAITGTDAVSFARGISTCGAATLAPGKSCTVEVRFTPTSSGAKSASLTFTDSAPGSPHSVALTGTGTATTPPPPTTVPTVTAKSPASGATGVAGTSAVTATFSENVSGVTGTTFTLTNGTTAVPATVTYNATTHVATLKPSAALANDTKYTAALKAGITNATGGALAPTSWSFTTGPRPTVTAKSPASNATGVAGTSAVTATFSENVTGVSGTTFTLKTAAGTAVPATVTYNATTHVATLTPSAALANDTKYTAALTTGIKDAGGNPIAATTWSFTTGPRPTVTAKTPANLATGVARNASVTATFSENVTGVSATTVTLKPFSATGTLGTAITATVSYNATTHVATLKPSALLAASTKYRADLTTGIKDAAGNPIAATNWTFTTGTV